MKVTELEGALLDYWAAKAQGRYAEIYPLFMDRGPRTCWVRKVDDADSDIMIFRPSLDWADGGPIIERERIQLVSLGDLLEKPTWQAMPKEAHPDDWMVAGQEGETALIAAMRCFVASVYGDEVPDAPG